MAIRDHPGPGAQPRILPGGLRDHRQGVDAAIILTSRAVLHDSARVDAMEPSADDRVLRTRQGGPEARRGAEHRRTRSLRRRESGDAERYRAQRAAGVSAADSAAASANVGAAHDRAID